MCYNKTNRGDEMIYGAISEKDERYYTYLKKVFEAIGNVQQDYNWLITDCECCPRNIETEKLLNAEYCWITGEQLTEIVLEEDFQWIWAVLSGFEKNIDLSEVLKYDLPYADEYRGFWENPLTLQHPLAHIEIVPWDSSLTLLLSDDKDIVDRFKKGFRYSEDLEKYNNLF